MKGFSQMSILLAAPNGHDPISHHYYDMLCPPASRICYLKWNGKQTLVFARPRLESDLYLEQYVCNTEYAGHLGHRRMRPPSSPWSFLGRAEAQVQRITIEDPKC